jgi:CubicO group peptidase (beta-lactamase class C family)
MRLRALAVALTTPAPASAAGELPSTHRNASLVVHEVPGTQGGQGEGSTLAGWMMPDTRRRHFRTPSFGHQNINMRASSVMELTPAPDTRVPLIEKVAAATAHECFCGMVVLKSGEVVFEAYAEDFSADTPHSMQSITKTTVNLMVGKLVDEGKVDLSTTIKEIIPECGSGYADATLQQVLDMAVKNMFAEGYADDYNDASVSEGYSRQEVGLGWRLPPVGERRFGMREFIAAIKAPPTEDEGSSGYKSPNNDLMAWVVERVSGRSIAAHLQDIVEAAGLEGSFHCACDVDWVPITSGGGFMTNRDLARYGQLLCRRGVGVDGSIVGSGPFLDESRKPPPSMQDVFEGGAVKVDGWYHNQMQSNGKYIGHGGFGGQWMAADEKSGCSVSFFSVFNADGGVNVDLQEMSEEIFQLFR